MSSQYGRIIRAACVRFYPAGVHVTRLDFCALGQFCQSRQQREQSAKTQQSASQQRYQTRAALPPDTRRCEKLTATCFFTSSSLFDGNLIVIGWIATFCTDIHSPQRMNPSDFGNPLTFFSTYKKIIGLKIDPAHVDGLISLCWCRSSSVMINVGPGPSLQLINQAVVISQVLSMEGQQIQISS